MAKKGGGNEDFLGVLAFASGVGNLVQAADRHKLQAMYDQLVVRYKQVQSEYTAMRNFYAELQKQVAELRIENSRLKAELSKRPEAFKT